MSHQKCKVFSNWYFPKHPTSPSLYALQVVFDENFLQNVHLLDTSFRQLHFDIALHVNGAVIIIAN